MQCVIGHVNADAALSYENAQIKMSYAFGLDLVEPGTCMHCAVDLKTVSTLTCVVCGWTKCWKCMGCAPDDPDVPMCAFWTSDCCEIYSEDKGLPRESCAYCGEESYTYSMDTYEGAMLCPFICVDKYENLCENIQQLFDSGESKFVEYEQPNHPLYHHGSS